VVIKGSDATNTIQVRKLREEKKLFVVRGWWSISDEGRWTKRARGASQKQYRCVWIRNADQR